MYDSGGFILPPLHSLPFSPCAFHPLQTLAFYVINYVATTTSTRQQQQRKLIRQLFRLSLPPATCCDSLVKTHLVSLSTTLTHFAFGSKWKRKKKKKRNRWKIEHYNNELRIGCWKQLKAFMATGFNKYPIYLLLSVIFCLKERTSFSLNTICLLLQWRRGSIILNQEVGRKIKNPIFY